jgi:hypothetical protein
MVTHETPATFDGSAPDEMEIMSGAMLYLNFLRRIHKKLSPHFYVEIGVRHGRSLALASCHAIGIDPRPDITVRLSPKTTIFQKTSDDFFDRDAVWALQTPIDFAFIDGMHLIEHVLRDFINIERHAHPASVVVFDDIFPNHPLQAERRRQSRVWAGDVWKIVSCLRTQRPDLLLLPIDAYPTGFLMVVGLDPGSQRLNEKYDEIILDLTDESRHPVPTKILDRSGALMPDDPKIAGMLKVLRKTRDNGEGRLSLADQLRNWRSVLGQ